MQVSCCLDDSIFTVILALLLQIWVNSSGLFEFPYHFCPFLIKSPQRFKFSLFWIELFRKINILRILNLSIYKHDTPLHLLRSSLDFFIVL